MPLTLDQQKAMNAMNAGLNVFLTGDAGTGKSYVVNQFLEGREDFIVCAPTGIAAPSLSFQSNSPTPSPFTNRKDRLLAKS